MGKQVGKLLWGERLYPEKLSDASWDHRFRYLFARQYCLGKTILDCGCGVGYGSDYLAFTGAKKVIGIDVSEAAISVAKKQFQRTNLKFAKMDGTKLRFPSSSFDVVVSFEVIEHLEDCDAYLSEIHRVLRKGSIYLASTPNKKVQDLMYPPSKDGRPGWKWHVKEFNDFEYRSLLEIYFSKVKLLYVVVNRKDYLQELVKQAHSWKTMEIVYGLSSIFPIALRKKIGKTLRIYPTSVDTNEIILSEVPINEAAFFLSICQK